MIPYEFIQIAEYYLICYPNGTIFHVDKKTKKWIPIISSDNGTGYLITAFSFSGKRCMLLCHRIIAYAFGIIDNLYSPYEIDHIDRDRTNNCIFNLRTATSHQNKLNRAIFGKGYYLHGPTSKWLAKINKNGKSIHLGYFEKEDDAIEAVKNARKINSLDTYCPRILFPKRIVIDEIDKAKLALFTTIQNIKIHSLKYPKKHNDGEM